MTCPPQSRPASPQPRPGWKTPWSSPSSARGWCSVPCSWSEPHKADKAAQSDFTHVTVCLGAGPADRLHAWPSTWPTTKAGRAECGKVTGVGFGQGCGLGGARPSPFSWARHGRVPVAARPAPGDRCDPHDTGGSRCTINGSQSLLTVDLLDHARGSTERDRPTLPRFDDRALLNHPATILAKQVVEAAVSWDQCPDLRLFKSLQDWSPFRRCACVCLSLLVFHVNTCFLLVFAC